MFSTHAIVYLDPLAAFLLQSEAKVLVFKVVCQLDVDCSLYTPLSCFSSSPTNRLLIVLFEFEGSTRNEHEESQAEYSLSELHHDIV